MQKSKNREKSDRIVVAIKRASNKVKAVNLVMSN